MKNAVEAREVLKALERCYPQAAAELHFSNPFETLIATMLSAQCTDRRVNEVTQVLFSECPDAYAMAALSQEALEGYIRTCGLYHTKAKNILKTCRILINDWNGCVPADRKALMALPGVGQKTAGVVLMAAFGEDQIPVDTHVFRVARRIGLADETTPEKVEAQLRSLLPKEKWSFGHHLLIWHGRRVCHALHPECERCALNEALCENKTGADALRA